MIKIKPDSSKQEVQEALQGLYENRNIEPGSLKISWGPKQGHISFVVRERVMTDQSIGDWRASRTPHYKRFDYLQAPGIRVRIGLKSNAKWQQQPTFSFRPSNPELKRSQLHPNINNTGHACMDSHRRFILKHWEDHDVDGVVNGILDFLLRYTSHNHYHQGKPRLTPMTKKEVNKTEILKGLSPR